MIPISKAFDKDPIILTLRIGADLIIATCYFLIPFLLVRTVRRLPIFTLTPHMWLFSAFIMSCGMIFVMDVVLLWQPTYAVDVAIRAFTGLASIMALVALFVASDTLVTWFKYVATQPIMVTRYEAVLDAMVDAVIVADERGRITGFNAAAVTIFGYTPTEFLGMQVMSLIPQRLHGRHRRAFEGVASGERKVLADATGIKTHGVRKNRDEFECTVVPFAWREHGEIVIGSIIRDHTHRPEVIQE
ncbi:MAG TPA: PAS domain S-box protein [Gemmatimonadales bacterium]